MIDPKTETIIPLTEAPKYYPGHRPHKGTAIRHATKGIDGKLLESIKIAGRKFTSVQAIDRFISALNSSPQRPQTTKEAMKNDVIDLQLDAAGF